MGRLLLKSMNLRFYWINFWLIDYASTKCVSFNTWRSHAFFSSLAGSAIEASLKQLAERRTDIFGVGDEETAIGKKIGEEDKRKDDKVILIVILNIMHLLATAVFAEVLDNSQRSV